MPVPEERRDTPRGTNLRLVLRSHLTGRSTSDVFELDQVPISAVGPGQLLIRNSYLSVDPAMRTWSAAQPGRGEALALGSVMRAYAVGQVTISNHPRYPVGTCVTGPFGAQYWCVSDGSNIRQSWGRAPIPITSTLGVLGHIGLTAMVGLQIIAIPKPGETVLVSSAAGAVGSLAAQIAKLVGANVIGIAGGLEKVRLCRDEYGFEAIDYQASQDLTAEIAGAAPSGIDVFFDNVGGSILDAALPNMNPRGRIAICGTISIDSADPGQGPRLERRILDRELTVTGFLQSNYAYENNRFLLQLGTWHREGRLKLREEIFTGLKSLPVALEHLLHGKNLGKVLIDVNKEAP